MDKAHEYGYERISISGFSVSLGPRLEGRSSCRLTLRPYCILKWPDSFRLIHVEIHFSGSPCKTQLVEARTNDEFGVQDISDLGTALNGLVTNEPISFQLRGSDGHFDLGIAGRDGRAEFVGRIGVPYLEEVFSYPENARLREETVFNSTCNFRLWVPQTSLAEPIAEIDRFLRYLHP